MDEHGSRELAKTYLDYLYPPEGQKIAAEFGNRIRESKVAEKFKNQSPQVRLVTVEDVFGGWSEIQEKHFANGALLDQLFTAKSN